MKLTLKLASLATISFASLGFSQLTVPDMGAQANPPVPVFTKDMTVYVRDFELDADNVKVDSGVVGRVRPGLIERPSKRAEHDPQAQARKLVETMSKSLISDLQKAGYKAERLGPDDASPATGALVSGVFTEVDEGNRMHRALIGFGSGSAKMELYVTLSNLASPQKPLYDVTQQDTSGKRPGAAITLNPYVAAVKFAMEKNAPEKTVKKTAAQISKEVVSYLEKPRPAAVKTALVGAP